VFTAITNSRLATVTDVSESGPDRYHYAEHRNYLCTVRRRRSRRPGGVGLHDWGSALGFDWANRQRVRAADIAHMEAIAMPLNWSVFPDPVLGVCSRLRSPEGESMA